MYENHEEQSSGSPPPHEFYGQQSHQQQPSPERKSPLTATLLSCMPGLGQVYVGYYQRGFVNIAVAAGVIFLLNQYELREFQPLLGVFLPFFWIYNMIDAARCAHSRPCRRPLVEVGVSLPALSWWHWACCSSGERCSGSASRGSPNGGPCS